MFRQRSVSTDHLGYIILPWQTVTTVPICARAPSIATYHGDVRLIMSPAKLHEVSACMMCSALEEILRICDSMVQKILVV